MTATAPIVDDQILDAEPRDDDELVAPADDEVEVVPAPPAKRRKASTDVAKAEKNEPEIHKVVLDDGWEHERLEFRGDDLAIRKPTKQALSGVTLVASKYVATNVQNDVLGLFIARHLGPDSYGRVMFRMVDPDDADYSDDTVMVLLNKIMNYSPDTPEKSE
jgi:hypothetical protein